MALSLELFIPAMGPTWQEAATAARDTMSKPWNVEVDDLAEGEDAGYLSKVQRFHDRTHATVEGLIHADLYLLEKSWDQRVLAQFEDEKVGVVGIVGARRLGHADIYKIPYDYTQLARADVLSNLVDAEAHGARFVGETEVAVLDSCALFVRHSLLDVLGGWPVSTYPNNTHCTDLWISLMARRRGLQTKLVGVKASHRSGGKGDAGVRWLDERGGDVAQHRKAHELTYDQFRDVLPVRIG